MNLEIMNDWDAMRLADVLTIAEAACCIVGVPTTRLGFNTMTDPYLQSAPGDGTNEDVSYAVFNRVVKAVSNSIRAGKLQAVVLNKGEHQGAQRSGEETECLSRPPDEIDPWVTLIDVDTLKAWLVSRNLRPPFFFPDETVCTGDPDYLNPKHPRYSGRLAAAVHAWLAVSDTDGKSPKQALEKWLREHAALYGMTSEEGNPVNQTVEECSKVANWDRGGGAPKTPTRAKPPTARA
ncbi:MAG: hypothetical protein KA173_10045 [Rhodoferax sp.]|nr:hypothetical protein [Rhodoferax sp.]MBP7493468.1 hypothetical protein [Rhodoferax sp.]